MPWTLQRKLSIGQGVIGIIVIGIGVFYDIERMTPGVLTVGGLSLLVGPGLIFDIFERRRLAQERRQEQIAQLAGQFRASITEREEK